MWYWFKRTTNPNARFFPGQIVIYRERFAQVVRADLREDGEPIYKISLYNKIYGSGWVTEKHLQKFPRYFPEKEGDPDE